MSGEEELWKGVGAGLLSSSCCALQLALNGLGYVGCAGFNKVLGPPVRGYLRLCTWAWLLGLWAVRNVDESSQKSTACINQPIKSSRTRLIRVTVATLLLTYLPELLRLHGNGFFVIRTTLPRTNANTNIRIYEFVVDNMACEACESEVRSILNGSRGVTEVKHVDWTTGIVRFSMMPDAKNEDELFIKLIGQDLMDSGFELQPVGHVTKKSKLDAQNNIFESSIEF